MKYFPNETPTLKLSPRTHLIGKAPWELNLHLKFLTLFLMILVRLNSKALYLSTSLKIKKVSCEINDQTNWLVILCHWIISASSAYQYDFLFVSGPVSLFILMLLCSSPLPLPFFLMFLHLISVHSCMPPQRPEHFSSFSNLSGYHYVYYIHAYHYSYQKQTRLTGTLPMSLN